MARTLSSTFRQAIESETTSEVVLVCLTITEDSLAAPIRLVHNTENITRQIEGSPELFVAMLFEIDLPSEDGDTIDSVSIKIDNVDRQIVEAVENATGRPQVSMEIVLASDPDTVEAGPIDMELDSVEYDSMWVVGQLVFDELVNQQSAAHTYSPFLFPDLFP